MQTEPDIASTDHESAAQLAYPVTERVRFTSSYKPEFAEILTPDPQDSGIGAPEPKGAVSKRFAHFVDRCACQSRTVRCSGCLA